MWTPYRIHRDFVIFYYTEFTGVPMDSMWTPHGFTVFFGSEFTRLSVDSI